VKIAQRAENAVMAHEFEALGLSSRAFIPHEKSKK